MVVELKTMPDANHVESVPTPNMSRIATLRIITPRRRLDRFWQMVEDETQNFYKVGTYSIPGDDDLKLCVVDVMKPKSETLTDDELSVFAKYRFVAVPVEGDDDPLKLGSLGEATVYQYEGAKIKTRGGEGFV